MSNIVPPKAPEIHRPMVDAWLRELPEPAATRALTYAGGAAPFIVGRRGYYANSMGRPGMNERGIYDDAIVVGGLGAWETFNANTDPSKERPGIATLVPGVWHYQLGIHGITKPVERQYPALVQAAAVSVRRDGKRDLSTGWFGINIHRGGKHETLSEGCQTIYKSQWQAFYNLVRDLMAEAGAITIPYILTERATVEGT